MELSDPEKFSLIALPVARLVKDFPDEYQLSKDLWITTSLPTEPEDHWTEWLGTTFSKKLSNADLFLVSRCETKNPGVLDEENNQCSDRALKLYWGLLISNTLRTLESPISLTGSYYDSRLNVRSIGRMAELFHTPGTPLSMIDLERMKLAVVIAEALDSLPGKGQHARLFKVFHAFYAGAKAHFAENRLHQFIRCVEGFILPEIGRTETQFKSRTELFIGPKYHSVISHLYKIRSSVEHLHDPLGEITGATRKDKLVHLFLRSYQAECLARYCLTRVLTHPELLPYFDSDSTITSFWQLDNATRQEIWGEQLDFHETTEQFRERSITDAHLT